MIDLRYIDDDLKIDVVLFKVDSGKRNIKEIFQAILGENFYNNTITDWAGLIYESEGENVNCKYSNTKYEN